MTRTASVSCRPWVRLAIRPAGKTLSDLGLTPAQFQLLAANAGIKVALARRLRRETTLSLKWIAQQLGVGSWKYLSNVLGQEAPKCTQAQIGL